MTTNVTISNLYWNRGLREFFFRQQATDTLAELVNRSHMEGADTLDILDDYTEDMSLDEVEEMFYSDKIEDIAEYFGITLKDE